MATEQMRELGIPVEREEKASSTEQFYVAPQWKLMYWKFRRHRMAVISVFVLAIFYFMAAFCEFVSPYKPLPPSVEGFWDTHESTVLVLGHTHIPMIDRGPRGIEEQATRRPRDPQAHHHHRSDHDQAATRHERPPLPV